MRDLIDRQEAINALHDEIVRRRISEDANDGGALDEFDTEAILRRLPSAQPEISRIEQELHGKTPEEQYEFLYWLLLKFGLSYTDSRLAVIEWLRGEKEDE